MVYVFEEEKRNTGINIGSVTIKVGLDGAWVGANHGKSYFFFPVDPGDHHLCTAWQSVLKTLSQLGSAASLAAEAGMVYYFRTRVDEINEHRPAVKLEPVDSAEGQLLVASSSLSSSHPKK
ncbi:MAG: hypothetical protein WAR24_23585 [Candidatus Acidiferrales bacterium]